MEIVFSEKKPIYKQIVEFFQLEIYKGKFKPGDKLPSLWNLLKYISVNPNTMKKALKELEMEGLIYKNEELDFIITEDEKIISDKKNDFFENKIEVFLKEMTELGLEKEILLNHIRYYKKE